jgi:hypothetical protein
LDKNKHLISYYFYNNQSNLLLKKSHEDEKMELTPWVSTELLNSNEAIQNYLEACLEDGDPILIVHAMDVIASAREKNDF